MSEVELDPDLVECAREPIHLPGAIQPHGALLVLDESGLVVVRASANVAAHLGRGPDDVLGARVTDLVEGFDPALVGEPDLDAVNPLPLLVDGRPLDGLVHRLDGLLVLEVEPAADQADALATSFHRVRGALGRLHASASVEQLAELAAREVRRISGFDRVMLYRFTKDYDGEVIAEDRRDDLEPFLGLRYPASDIPPQARALYLGHWMRLIADVDYEPAPILPEPTTPAGDPLDLGGASLRSVSPVHLEYLRNMGVAASMSVSLIDRGRLWGLIACHHYDGPRRPPYRVRAAMELIGRTTSLLLATTQTAGGYERALAAREAETRVVERLGDPAADVTTALEQGPELLDVVAATGLVASFDGSVITLGDVPGDLDARALARRLLAGEQVASASDLGAPVAGALACRIGAGTDQWLLWLRPEVVQTVTWGGDPNAKVVRAGDRLSPRTSFAAWVETVRGCSDPWHPDDHDTATRMATTIGTALLRRSRAREALAETMQRTLLLEQLPDVPGTQVAARYEPSSEDAIGGDWYDLFWLPDGRIAIAVGDVAGHGMQAAPVMAQLRHGLRAYLLQEASPAGALRRLNELAGHLLPTDLASLVVADLEPSTRRLRLSSAGHLPALVVNGGEPRLHAGRRGPALGVAPTASYADEEVDLSSGGAVFLYTDGLVERRTEGIDESLERLLVTARTLPTDLDAACDRLLDQRPVDIDDDVTLLALRVDIDGGRPGKGS